METPIPPLVTRATEAANAAGFPLVAGPGRPSCCSPHTGRLLAVLAAGCGGGRIGEIGTGTGYGAAWMASAMPADTDLVTVELDPVRADVARGLFADDPRVRVLDGDAADVIGAHGPFSLLFVDGGSFSRDPDAFRTLIDLVAVGGRLVVDDVTPAAALPPDSPFRAGDPKRENILASPALVAVEVVAPTLAESALVATRIR